VLFIGAIVIGLVARDALETAWLQRALGGAIGGDATIGGLRHGGGMRVLDNVRLRTGDGAVTLTAEHVSLADRSGTLAVEAAGVRAAVVTDRIGADELGRLGALGAAFGAERLVLHVDGANADLARSDGGTPLVRLTGITATAKRDASAATYDVHLTLNDASGAYPVRGNGSSDASGRAQATWTAPRLPVASLVALLPQSELAVREGTARDVALAAHPDGGRLVLTLDGVGGTLREQELHGLAGPLVITEDGLGTAGITGTVGTAAPLTLAGEVHDPAGWTHLFAGGSHDLRALAHLFEMMASQANVKWLKLETTAPGVQFGQYAMTTKDIPHVVQLLAVNPHEPTLHFGTALAQDHIISHGERTSDLGIRTNAIAGVNGDYFDIGRTYEPEGLLIKDGTLLHGPTDHYALTVDRQNHVRFGIFHLTGQVVHGERSYRISQINSWPAKYVAVITPDYGKLLPAAPEMTYAELAPAGGNKYRIVSLQRATEPLAVRFGLGFGRLVQGPLPRPGDVVEVSYAVDPPLGDTLAAISSGPLLLKDGQWFEDTRAPAPDERNVQWPVIAVGTMPDETLLMAAVDGRHPERSIGMTRPEFAELLRGFGVLDAMALDSGGSVTMVSRAPGDRAVTVRNHPSDDSYERYVSDGFFVYSNAPPGSIVVPRLGATAKPAG
jgi:exopolysaccharide biosynthesis protein